MAVVLSLRWPGLTPEQYDTVRNTVRWEEQVPEGAVLHVAWFDGGALCVTDVWNDVSKLPGLPGAGSVTLKTFTLIGSFVTTESAFTVSVAEYRPAFVPGGTIAWT